MIARGYVASALANVFPPTMAMGARFVFTLDAYFDESGLHDASKSICVAGYLARPEQWTAFDVEWRQALADFGIAQFHMTEFANRIKAFASWTEEERRHRFLRLVDIINRNVVASVGVVFSRSMFNDVFPKYSRKYLGGPYGLAVSACAISASAIAKELHPEAWIAYRFESGALGWKDAGQMFTDNLNDEATREHYRLLSFAYERKQVVTMFQASDILAYELYRYLPTITGESAATPRMFHLEPLSKHGRRAWSMLGRQELERFQPLVIERQLALRFAAQRNIVQKARKKKQKKRGRR